MNEISRIALGIEYDGSLYYGWQRQKEVASVQEKLEVALSQIAGKPIDVYCAGRTDAGVHAKGQVIHFESDVSREDKAWTMGVNALLPPNIAVQWIQTVDQTFHARYSATARRYCYVIYNHRYRNALSHSGIAHYYLPLDEDKMHQAAQHLVGEHDFTSFRAAQCQSHSPCRNIVNIVVKRINYYIIIDIKANAFVHHMVRNIVGSLLEVGYGRQQEEWIAQLLAVKDRTQAAATAKPNGLYLVSVDYPKIYNLPETPMSPLFFSLT